MSDDNETPPDDPKKKGKGKGRSEDSEKTLVEPSPTDEDFFLWLEKLFSDNQYPEKLDLRVVELLKGGKEKFGARIAQKLFPPNTKRDKEQIVALSNELVHLAQRDCNIHGRAIIYGVYAQHFAKDDDYYERFLMRLAPNAAFGRGAPELAEARDDDDPALHEKFSVQVLTHQQQMFQLYASGLEGLVDRLDRIVERQDVTIEKQTATIQRQSEMMERAMSMEAEREERRRWTDLKIKGVEKIIEFGVTMGPPLLGQLLGKPVSDETPESITLKKYFREPDEGGVLTKEQIDVVFGVYDEKTNVTLRAGVLTKEQAMIIWRVAHCQIPPDALDELLPGGACEVSQEQFANLMGCGLSMEQLAPIHIIFQGRMSRKQAK